MKTALCFDDVLLEPQYSDIESRSEVDLSTTLKNGLKLSLPLISSPMDTVTENQMALSLGKAGGLGIIHRYNTLKRQKEIASLLVDSEIPFGIAIGVKDDYLQRIHNLISLNPKWLIVCIDIAHGHHILMERAIKSIRDRFLEDVLLIAGNIATPQAFQDLKLWGADIIKLSIGSGAICSTRIQTGHGIPTLQAIIDCQKVREPQDPMIISDGGIRNAGDACKCIAAGAHLIMGGSLFAGTDEAPGEIHWDSNGPRKIYRGMSSNSSQMDWRGYVSSQEGVSTTVHYKGPVQKILDELTVGIKSGLSYSGARNLDEFREKAKFVRQTQAGLRESGPHIL